MRKIIASLVLLAATLTGVAVAQSPSHFVWASAYNNWSLPGVSPNTYTFNATTNCIADPYSGKSFNFATTAPVYVNDLGLDSNSEIVTPSSIINSVGTCGFAASFSHPHVGFQVQSGTAGLQEALNSLNKSSTYPAVVMVDSSFYAGAVSIGSTAASLIGAAKGGTGIAIVDTTTAPFTWYSWSGSAYVAVTSAAGSVTANGASVVYGTMSENVTLGGTTSTDSTTNLLPANSIIDAVAARVTTTIATTTAWELGDASTAARFTGSQTSGQLTAGATVVGGPFAVGTGLASATTGAWQTSAAKVRITQTGTPSAGAIRITVFFHTYVAPTS